MERIRSGASQLEEGTQSPGLEYFAYVHCMLLACMFVLFALGPHRQESRRRENEERVAQYNYFAARASNRSAWARAGMG